MPSGGKICNHGPQSEFMNHHVGSSKAVWLSSPAVLRLRRNGAKV